MNTYSLKNFKTNTIVFGDQTVINVEDYAYFYKNLKERLSKENITSLSKLINGIDNEILDKIRTLSNKGLTNKYIFEIYSHVISDLSNKQDVNLFLLLDILNNADLNLNQIENEDIRINVEKELRKIEFVLSDYKFIVEDPQLLWECNEVVSGACDYKNCKTHKQFKSENEALHFSEKFKRGLNKIVFDSIPTYWKQYPNLWPASIDTFHLINDLRYLNYDKRYFETVVDIGTGTGMLGLWLANNNSSIKEMILTDWLLLPLIYSNINAKVSSSKCKFSYSIGLNTTLISTKKLPEMVDLIICNPPYLPELGFDFMLKKTTVAGTELLTSIIKNFRKITKEVVISFSDLALPEAINAGKEAGISILDCKVSEPHVVPFRVKAAFQEQGYIDKLKDENRMLIEKNDKIFPYWHNINTYVLKNNN